MSKKTLVVIDAGTLYTPDNSFSPGRLLIEGTSIAAVGTPESVPVPAAAGRLDASGLVVVPGFIDPHIHGCGGVDVMEGTHESLNLISRILVRHGTTAFLATTVSSPPDLLKRAAQQLGAAISKPCEGAEPLGIHMEGPFISAAKRGTHQASHILPPNLDLLASCIQDSANSVRLLTVAPELEGIVPLLMLARHHGVTVAMGHSNATFDQARNAADQGILYAVHTFNAMRSLSHRDPGITGEVLSDDRIFAEIIADGVHVDEAVVRVFARAKGKTRVLLVTDAISATDMPDGCYRLGGNTVNVADGIGRDPEGRLAGSTLTQEVALRNFSRWTGWRFEDVLLGLTLNTAKALKLDRKGVIAPGADADIVILDQDFRVMTTLVGGRVVFNRNL